MAFADFTHDGQPQPGAFGIGSAGCGSIKALSHHRQFFRCDAIAKGRTVFIIAHRLSAVRHANRIIVLERGRIIEQGEHAGLIEKGGVYANLHALQNGD